MLETRLSRRRLVAVLLTGLAAGKARSFWTAQRDDREFLKIALPATPDFDNPSFELFLSLSKLVTLREQLNVEMAEKMYPLFINEPWGTHHISSTYQQLLNLVGPPPYTVPPYSKSSQKNLGPGQAWFSGHLLTTWYLGIYYHESRPSQRVGYEHSLMFDAIRGVLPIPFVESTGFSGWVLPPTAKS